MVAPESNNMSRGCPFNFPVSQRRGQGAGFHQIFHYLGGSKEKDIGLCRYDPLPRAPEVFRLLIGFIKMWLLLLFKSEAVPFEMI